MLPWNFSGGLAVSNWFGMFFQPQLERRSQHNPTTFQGSREVSKDPPLTRLPFLDYCSRWQCCRHVETCKMTRYHYHFAGAFFGPNVVGGRTTCSDLFMGSMPKRTCFAGLQHRIHWESTRIYHNTVYHNTGNCSIHSWCPEFMLQHEYANITYTYINDVILYRSPPLEDTQLWPGFCGSCSCYQPKEAIRCWLKLLWILGSWYMMIHNTIQYNIYI